MAVSRRKTHDVLASAREDLRAQLVLVREEIGRLAAEEHALTRALSSLDGDTASKADRQTHTGQRPTQKSSTRKAASSRARRVRGASKSTADRVKELQGLLADGPRSRGELAAVLKVSPARVQQLLAELGSAVSSGPDPQQRQGKLWSLKGSGNDASAARATAKRSSGRAKPARARKPSARKVAAAK